MRNPTSGTPRQVALVAALALVGSLAPVWSADDAAAAPDAPVPEEPEQPEDPDQPEPPEDPVPDDPDDDPATSRFVPLLPCRLLDTRADTRAGEVDEPDDHTLRLGTDDCDIPVGATAIVATTTVVNAESTGWLVTFPTGTPQPFAATLNWQVDPASRDPATRGNTTTIAVGASAEGEPAFDVYRSIGNDDGDLVIDVTGAFVPAAEATSGRYIALDVATRLLDTRRQLGRLEAGSTVRVVPPTAVSDHATALAVTITAVRTDGPTFVTAFPAGELRPTTSLLNTDATDQTRSTTAIVPVSADGLDVFVSAGTHLTIDATGWFTGDAPRGSDSAVAVPSTDGLFVVVPPRRLRDTRPEIDPIHEGGTIEIEIPGDLTGDTSGVTPASVVVSTTLIGADETGYLTLHAARTARPETASAYSLRNELTAQFVVSDVSDHGVAVFSERGTDITVDLLGWFTGSPVEATSAQPAPNPFRTQRVLAVGDSTMAGIRWYDAFDALRGASWTFDGESCRKLAVPSCFGREDRRPPSAVRAIESRPDVFDVLVVMTGYNDGASTFERDVERVMGAARSQGIRRVVWLTYSRETLDDLGGADAWQVFEYQNEYLRWLAPQHDDLVLAEWAQVPREQPAWFHDDGIHFTHEGSFGAADFMSRAVAMVTGRPCPVPSDPDGDETADPDDDPADPDVADPDDVAENVCGDPAETPLPDMHSLYEFVETTTQCWEVGPDRDATCVTDIYAEDPLDDPDGEPADDPDAEPADDPDEE